eukprot:183787-Chlamydomonas_euryale.AAC.3
MLLVVPAVVLKPASYLPWFLSLQGACCGVHAGAAWRPGRAHGRGRRQPFRRPAPALLPCSCAAAGVGTPGYGGRCGDTGVWRRGCPRPCLLLQC